MLFYTNDISIYIGNLNPIPHEHNAIEIAIGAGAQLTLKLNSGKSITAQAFILLANVKHQVLINPNGGEKITINIDAELPIARLISKKIIDDGSCVYILDEKFATKYANKFIKLKANAIQENGACIYNQVYALINEFYPSINYEQPALVDNRIKYITSYIKQNIKEQSFCFKDFADEVELSESRLAHLFKNEMGLPFRKYVLWTRLKTAVVHILEGESLTQASYIAGFSDSSHFSNVYFKMFGLKPSSPLRV